MNDLVAVPNSTALDAPLHPDDAAAVSQDKRNSKAANTQRAYRAALSDSAKSEINAKRATTHRKYPTFTAWCADRGYPALPSTPAHVAAYLSALARMRASVPTIEQRRSAIAWAWRR